MEHAPGISLHQKWPTMDIRDQIECMDALYQKLKEIVDLEFPAYGSLYFTNTPNFPASKLSLDQEYCVGPNCGAMYWNCHVGQPRYYHEVNPNQGPCKSTKCLWTSITLISTPGLDFLSYCDGLVDTGISRVPPAGAFRKRPRYHGSIQTQHKLPEHGRAVIKKMAEDARIQNAASPIMFHPDLHKRNIFVSMDDPTVITAIIDWQSCSIEPAFWYADEVPDFAQPVPDPSCEDRIEPKSMAWAKAHNICTQFIVPKLSEPRLMDQSFFRAFRYCHRTWEDGTVAFREDLIQTSLHWKDLGLANSAPYPLPDPDELAAHRRNYKLFQAAQRLRYTVSSLLNTATDG